MVTRPAPRQAAFEGAAPAATNSSVISQPTKVPRIDGKYRQLADSKLCLAVIVDFVTLSGEFDTSTAQGKLLLQVKGAFDEFWSNLAQERANEMVQRRREEGKPIGRPKKLDADQLEQVREWNKKGLSYSAIATLVEDAWGIEVDQSTIYRYCNEDGAESESPA